MYFSLQVFCDALQVLFFFKPYYPIFKLTLLNSVIFVTQSLNKALDTSTGENVRKSTPAETIQEY